jgi:hypothetical protein
MNATALSAEEDRVRQILSNRMAEIQATPGNPDPKRESKIETGYGQVVLKEKSAPSGLKTEKDIELAGINLVTLTAEWTRGGVGAGGKSAEGSAYGWPADPYGPARRRSTGCARRPASNQ